LTPAQEAVVHSMVPETALPANQNFEFSADQISCIDELQSAMNDIVYRCVYENLGDQAQLHALGLDIKGDGHQLIVELNFLYLGFSTKRAVELTKEITDFPSWFEKSKDPTDCLIKYQDLCIQLSNFEGYELNETMQCSLVLAALQKTDNYRQLIIQFDTSDAGSIKLKDLCSRTVKYFQNTHEGWGFNVTRAEYRGNRHDKDNDKSKDFRKQLNSMQDQIKQLGTQSKWKTGKRATPGGGNLGSKKSKRTPCVFCKGDHHPAGCNSKLKPEGTACFTCGKPGHKSYECPDKAAGSVNAITDATDKKSVAKKSVHASSEACPRCHRGKPGTWGWHLEADCHTKACPECDSLEAHNWNKCDGTAKAFYLCGSTEIAGEKSEGVRWYCKGILSMW